MEYPEFFNDSLRNHTGLSPASPLRFVVVIFVYWGLGYRGHGISFWGFFAGHGEKNFPLGFSTIVDSTNKKAVIG